MTSKKILGGGEKGKSADVNPDMATRNTAMGRDADVVIMFIIF